MSNSMVEDKKSDIAEEKVPEDERTNELLELSRKRKRTTQEQQQQQPSSSAAASSVSSNYCHEVGKPDSETVKLQKMTDEWKTILKCIGEDPTREGLLKTPERWAKALLFMTSGYSQTANEVLNGAVFAEDSHKEICMMCEHHMVPFVGRIHVGYIPNGRSEQNIDWYIVIVLIMMYDVYLLTTENHSIDH